MADRWSREQDKAYRYVGRFLNSFASIENEVNEMFFALYDLGIFASLILMRHLDLRKKLKLLELGFDERGIHISPKDTISRIHHLHNVRNAIAHSWFEGIPSGYTLQGGKKVKAEGGINFCYVDAKGHMHLPTHQVEKRKERHRKHGEDLHPDQSFMGYSEFDDYETECRAIIQALSKIKVTPLDQPTVEIARDISDILASSENVIRFPRGST